MALDEAGRAKIAPYVSSLNDDVFAISGLPEEVIAVLFAYYSRSRDDLRTNLARLLADQELDVGEGTTTRPSFGLATDKARAFHEKWVVGYGHASVAEHAVVHLAIENVSIVASKVIEDLRLGSYTEKSTRYVVFDRTSFVDLPELGERYRKSAENLFATYLELMPKVMDAVRSRSPRPPGMTEGAHAAAVRAQACDLLRGLLPAGTRTNLGLTANARALEGLLTKMLSNPLAEVRSIARAMHGAAQTVTPTLLKYAAKNEYKAGLRDAIATRLRYVYDPGPWIAGAPNMPSAPVRLVRHDEDALERIALALTYDASEPVVHAGAINEAMQRAKREALETIVRASLDRRGAHDAAPRAFEATTMTFELMLDYGAYRDLQRHRMLLPATQRLTCLLGFDESTDLEELGLHEPYHRAMNEARQAWEEIEAEWPLEAQYAVPLGFHIRTLWTLDLRELFHVIELRSSKQGHASYRRIAQGLYRAAIAALPWLEGLIRVDLNDYALSRG
jgi:thymidylate synthase ThyX